MSHYDAMNPIFDLQVGDTVSFPVPSGSPVVGTVARVENDGIVCLDSPAGTIIASWIRNIELDVLLILGPGSDYIAGEVVPPPTVGGWSAIWSSPHGWWGEGKPDKAE